MTRISIITVARNAAATIAEAVGSVQMQTYPHVEQLVIDGASSDATVEIARVNARTDVRLLSEPDRGLYDAMNKGVRLAQGEIIGFLNADDRYADPGVLERIVGIMEREGLDAAFGDVAFFRPEQPERWIRRYRSNHFHPDRIAWGWMPAHPALFIRKKVFDQVGLFKTDYKIAGDFEFVARAFHGRTIRYRHLPEVLVEMRTGGISTGGWRSTLLLNREVLRACKENGIRTSLPRILSKYPAKLLEFLHR